MKPAVVLTTVNVPEQLFFDYIQNFKTYNHKSEVTFIVIGDLKTPPAIKDVLNRVFSRGFDFEYWDISLQKKWLNQFPRFKKIIPYNSDSRRIIGYLRGIEKGADTIITIDDDNYPTNEDFLEPHSIVGNTLRIPFVSSSNGWYNICELLETKPKSRIIYPRGFPFSKRWVDSTISQKEREAKIVANLGLWIGEPDVDAVARLNEPVETTQLKQNRIVLAPGTYTPMNSQNTAILREAMPAYFYAIMQERIYGLKVDRYGDIWAGFFLQKVAHHLGDVISIGKPVTRHIRNRHDLLNDLKKEFGGMLVTEKFISMLFNIELTSQNYLDTAFELAQKILREANNISDRDSKILIKNVAERFQIWIDVISKYVS